MTTFGIIIGNRGFFPDALARDGRWKYYESSNNKATAPSA